MISSEERYEGDFEVRLEKLRFGVIHKKVGRSKCGLHLPAVGRDCGIQNTKNSMGHGA